MQQISKLPYIITNPVVQPILLDFINDQVLTELLPNITKYM